MLPTVIPSPPVLAAFTLAVLVLIITPGPDMTLFLGKTLAQGRRAGMAAMLGASTGLVVHTCFAAFGLSALLAASTTAFTIVKTAGALYLLWLAIDAVRRGSALSIERQNEKPQSPRTVYLMGLGVNLLNPKIILFFVTFLPQFVSASDPHAASKLVFLGFYLIALSIPSCAVLILLADRIALLVRRSPIVTRAVDWTFAGVFAVFALSLLIERARN